MTAKKIRFANNPTPDSGQKPRRLRLSALEIGVTGLIVVGLLYLVSMWMGWGYGPRPAPPGQQAGKALMEKALTASERVQAQIDVLRQEVAGLRATIDNPPEDLTPEQKAGAKPNRKLAAWANRVNQRLAALDRELKKTPGPDPKLAAKVEGLEKKLAALPKGKPPPAGEPAGPRLARLEKKLAELSGQTAAKLEGLKKELSARPAKAGPKAAKKLEERLAALRKDLEGKLAAMAKQNTAAGKAEAARQAGLKQLADKVAALAAESRQGNAKLGRELSALAARKPAANPALAGLAQKVELLQKELEGKVAELSGKLAAAPKAGDKGQGKALAALSQKVDQLARDLASRPAAQGGPKDSAGLDKRLAALEKGLEDERAVRDQAVRKNMETVVARLARLEEQAKHRPTGTLWPSLQVAELSKRIASLEKALPAGGGAGDKARLAARVAALEKKSSGASGSLWPSLQAAELGKRLDKLEKGLAALPKPRPADPRVDQNSRQLAALQQRLAASAAQDQAALKPLSAKIAALEKKQQGAAPAAQRNAGRLQELHNRLDKLGKALAEAKKEAARPDPRLAKLSRQVAELELKRKALENAAHRREEQIKRELAKKMTEQDQARQGALNKRITALESQVGGVARSASQLGPGLSSVSKRLDRLEGLLADTRRRSNPNGVKLTSLEDRLAALEGIMKDRGAVPPALLQRISRLEEQAGRGGGNAGADSSRRLAALSDRIQALEARLRQRRAAAAGPPAPSARPAARPTQEARPPAPVRIVHKVQVGETLFGLSRTYGVKVADIRRWNRITGNNLKAGTNIVIMQDSQ